MTSSPVEEIIQDSVRPTLKALYSNESLKLDVFRKALREQRIIRFSDDDVAYALDALDRTDPTLKRTAALLKIAGSSEAVEQWLSAAAKDLLYKSVGAAVTDIDTDAKQLFEALLRKLTPILTGKKGAPRDTAQNLLRISLYQLLRQRSLSPLDALRTYGAIGSKPKSTSALPRDVQRLVVFSSAKLLGDLAKVARLMDADIERAHKDRSDAMYRLGIAQEKNLKLERHVEEQGDKIVGLEATVVNLSQQLQLSRKDADEQRQLRGHDESEFEARARSFLQMRLRTLVSDAHDVLGFDQPNIGAAMQRLESALSAIDKEIKRDE